MPVASGLYYYTFENNSKNKNPPVVLIHGAGGSHLSWPPELRRLAGFKIYALDLPGHGKSQGNGEQSIEAYATQVADWMNALDLRRAFVIGHSMGGAIAMELGFQHAYSVMGLGLVATGVRLLVDPEILDDVSSQITFQGAVDKIVGLSYSAHAPLRLVELAGKRLAETRASVLQSDFIACDEFNFMEKLGDIRKPTLVICGDKDKMTPLRYSQFLVNRIPDSSLQIIPDAGHMVMLEKPNEVTQAITTFIENNRWKVV